MEKSFKTFYGTIPMQNGIVVTETAEKIYKHHIADKTNYGGKRKLSVEERIDLRNAIKKTPKQFMFNQKIKIA